jgi:hypothetical protein
VVQGSTQTFNRTVDDVALAAMRAADPVAALSKWDSEFRIDLTSFFDDAMIDGAVEHGRPLELPPRAGIIYKARVDASGGRLATLASERQARISRQNKKKIN